MLSDDIVLSIMARVNTTTAASLRSVCFKKKLRAASLSGLAHKTICSSSVSKFLQIGFKFPM